MYINTFKFGYIDKNFVQQAFEYFPHLKHTETHLRSLQNLCVDNIFGDHQNRRNVFSNNCRDGNLEVEKGVNFPRGSVERSCEGRSR